MFLIHFGLSHPVLYKRKVMSIVTSHTFVLTGDVVWPIWIPISTPNKTAMQTRSRNYKQWPWNLRNSHIWIQNISEQLEQHYGPQQNFQAPRDLFHPDRDVHCAAAQCNDATQAILQIRAADRTAKITNNWQCMFQCPLVALRKPIARKQRSCDSLAHNDLQHWAFLLQRFVTRLHGTQLPQTHLSWSSASCTVPSLVKDTQGLFFCLYSRRG
jgi:hypothetical protein